MSDRRATASAPDGRGERRGPWPAAWDEPPARRGRLLRWGLPRDPLAVRHLAAFLVTTMATVLLTRAYLAATGYPQIGGDSGLHLAHVLWGGLVMALAFVVLLSFAGPVPRRVGALLGGVGFGLFIDEIGKFVTADNDYFYEPTAALIYAVIVALVFLIEALHGRRTHHRAEYLAGAVDAAVAGMAGGLTQGARDRAHTLLDRAGGDPAVGALLDGIPAAHDELPDLTAAVWRRIQGVLRRIAGWRWTRWSVGGALLASTGISAGTAAREWGGDGSAPDWVSVAVWGSAAVCLALTGVGLWAVLRGRGDWWQWYRWAVLLSLLVTQIFMFRIVEWAATAGLLLDLLILGTLHVLRHADDLAAAEDGGVAVTGGGGVRGEGAGRGSVAAGSVPEDEAPPEMG